MKKNFLLYLAVIIFSFVSISCQNKAEENLKTAVVKRSTIISQISTVGIVVPRNRLEIKPQISGRVDEVLVNEGDNVKKGQTLVLMSSIERATLIDSARAKGQEEIKYWENVFKPAPIVAPLDGFIIKRNVEPGQSVSPQEAVLVMADKLIIKAQVDETDIGKIYNGQDVIIYLDAYPNIKIKGKVEHIAYESTVINNVNIYQVDIIPLKTPKFFRSGMSATANFVLSKKDNVLALPAEAIKNFRGGNYVLIMDKNKKISPIQVKIGETDGENTEIISKLNEGDEVIIPTAKLSKEFFPSSRRGGPPSIFGGRK